VKKVLLITDGSCLGNPGSGGWACILRFANAKKEFWGYDSRTTNNRMELMAAIQGLLALTKPCEVEITTDSEYVRRGITLRIARWKSRQWWNGSHPVRNVDLWIELDELAAAHRTTWLWTKGHASHEDNNRCDWLAQTAARTQTSSWPDGCTHAPMRYNLGWDYIPPKPQGNLFDAFETSTEEESDDSDALG
jgi:ribonuclease HI